MGHAEGSLSDEKVTNNFFERAAVHRIAKTVNALSLIGFDFVAPLAWLSCSLERKTHIPALGQSVQHATISHLAHLSKRALIMTDAMDITDITDISGDIDALEESITALEAALQPLIDDLNAVSSKLPLLDKAKLQTLVSYAIESLLFCKCPSIIFSSRD